MKKFIPKDIVFRDDARHRIGYFGHVETWYYDAMLNNGYSIVSLVNVIHIGRFGLVLSGIFIYKNGELLKTIRNRYPLKSFYGSEETIFIKLNNKKIIEGTIQDDQNWSYVIHRGSEQNGFLLNFQKAMKPFKGKTYLGDWLVIPSFRVNGILYVDHEEFHVKGEGYHDHNIYALKSPFITRGYFFGKIPLKNAYVIWARVIKNWKDIETIVILTTKDAYFSIDPRNIKFNIHESKKDHRKFIPYNCSLEVSDPILQLQVSFKPITYHHIGILAARYWRFHMDYIGTYGSNNQSNNIRGINIAEFLRFF